jgi:anti-anti-sigma factor
MKIVNCKEEDKLTIAVCGRVYTATVNVFEEQVLAEFTQKHNEPYQIVLDLSETEYISSAGLRILLLCQKEAKKNNISLIVANLHPEVKSVFDMSGFSKLLTIV